MFGTTILSIYLNTSQHNNFHNDGGYPSRSPGYFLAKSFWYLCKNSHVPFLCKGERICIWYLFTNIHDPHICKGERICICIWYLFTNIHDPHICKGERLPCIWNSPANWRGIQVLTASDLKSLLKKKKKHSCFAEFGWKYNLGKFWTRWRKEQRPSHWKLSGSTCDRWYKNMLQVI